MNSNEEWHRYFSAQFSEQDPWAYVTSEYEQTKYKRQIAAIDEHTDDPQRILEIGCAEGVHSEMLLEVFPDAELLGIDVSEQAITRARERLDAERAEFVAADAFEYIGEIDESFDVILWSECMFFMGDTVSVPEMFRYMGSVVDLLTARGVLVSANMVGVDGSCGGLAHPEVLAAYRRFLSSYSELVHYSEHTEYKAEEDEHLSYEIWAFMADD